MILWTSLLVANIVFVATSMFYWVKTIWPAILVIKSADAIAPLLTELREQLKDAPQTLQLLEEVAAQFRTNEGHTIRDVINHLATSAEEAKVTAEVLKASIAMLTTVLDRVDIKIDHAAIHADDIAQDLEASHLRAEGQTNKLPGEAADAAMQRPNGNDLDTTTRDLK